MLNVLFLYVLEFDKIEINRKLGLFEKSQVKLVIVFYINAQLCAFSITPPLGGQAFCWPLFSFSLEMLQPKYVTILLVDFLFAPEQT